MSRVFVAGTGAVSPAGWNVAALREALDQGQPLPIDPVDRPGWEKPLPARAVPNPATRPGFLAHPRLRRTSPITHYAASAATRSIGPAASKPGRQGPPGPGGLPSIRLRELLLPVL